MPLPERGSVTEMGSISSRIPCTTKPAVLQHLMLSLFVTLALTCCLDVVHPCPPHGFLSMPSVAFLQSLHCMLTFLAAGLPVDYIYLTLLQMTCPVNQDLHLPCCMLQLLELGQVVRAHAASSSLHSMHSLLHYRFSVQKVNIMHSALSDAVSSFTSTWP